MEISHAHFSEVTGMVFVEISSVMMLSTGHTTSTRMLSVLANAAVTSGDMATAGRKSMLAENLGASPEPKRFLCGFNLLFAGFGQSRRHCCDLRMCDVLGALGVVVSRMILGVCQDSLH